MGIDINTLPIIPALAFATRCAQLTLPHFENLYDDVYDDCAPHCVEIALQLAEAEKGTQILGPDGYADYCGDVSSYAHGDDQQKCAWAAEASAGLGYAAGMVANLYAGYIKEIPAAYYPNLKRALDAAMLFDELHSQLNEEFNNLEQLIQAEGLSDFSPIPRTTVESGFKP